MLQNSTDIKHYVSVTNPAIPKKRHGQLKYAGWGFKDTKIVYKDGKILEMVGPKMPPLKFVYAKKFMEKTFGVDLNRHYVNEIERKPEEFPPAVINEDFVNDLKSANIDSSDDFHERIMRSTCQSSVSYFFAKFYEHLKVADLVIFPENHDHVVRIVELANVHNVVLIPVGGTTNVSDSTHCPTNERRSIAVVDCTQMNRMLWMDEENSLACFEAGIVGKDLEKILNDRGFTSGHEPDSIEFSTLGGWVSTRASGMRRSKYGNIEEIVKDVKFVTSVGTIAKSIFPRVSNGPSIRDLIFGSEGTLGIVTEVVIKIHNLPKISKFGSIVFPNFDQGLSFLREMSKTSSTPAIMRLVDSLHCQMGKLTKDYEGKLNEILEPIKKCYLWYIKNFNEMEMCMVSYKLEGDEREVAKQEKTMTEVSKKYRGIFAGESYGKLAFRVTFLVGYFRDIMEQFHFFAESMETSIKWSNVKILIKTLDGRFSNEVKARNLNPVQCRLGYRISQVYLDGVCFYMYFSVSHDVIETNLKHLYEIKKIILDTFLECGGSISHHHGIGKKYKEKYLKLAESNKVELNVLRAVKDKLDPKNIFASGNSYTDTAGHDEYEKLKHKL